MLLLKFQPIFHKTNEKNLPYYPLFAPELHRIFPNDFFQCSFVFANKTIPTFYGLNQFSGLLNLKYPRLHRIR